MSHRDIVREQLRRDEGVKPKPYRCTAGKLTVGVGRNLDDNGLRPDEIEYLLQNDITQAEEDARSIFTTFDDLTDNRKAVLVNMSFNLGRDRLSKFRKLRKAIDALDFDTAYVEMVSSMWADQVGARATRLAKLMKDG